MNILKNIITIIAEIVILILAIIWFIRTKEEEPVIVIIGSSVFLTVSLITKLTDRKSRPKIVFHRKNDFTMRGPLGYTPNNPRVIRVGIDKVEQYWELTWVYDLEIRNNSSVTAYNYKVDFKNKPNRTEIKGAEIGKIQPIKPDDKFEFSFRLTQMVTGTHIDADKYLNENADKILKDMKIIASYSDEHDKSFTTEYDWISDSNKFK